MVRVAIDWHRIIIAGPDEQAVRLSGQAPGRQGFGAWLVEQLVQRGHPHAQAYCDSIAHEGRCLVSTTIQNDVEDSDARNLMVTAGAEEISSVADGHMGAVSRPAEVSNGMPAVHQ